MALTPEEQAELEQLKAEQAAMEQEQLALDSQATQQPAPLKIKPAPSMDMEEPDTSLVEDVLGVAGDVAQSAGSTISEYGTPILKSAAGIGEALTRGAVQDYTLESADEAEAKATAAVTGERKEDVLKRIRQQYKESEEQYPITTGIGRLGGSLAQGATLTALTGGAGAPVAAAKIVSKAGFITRLIKNALKGAAVGSAMGGLTAVGKSEKTTKKELIKEAKEGAKSGALVGGVLGGVAETGGTIFKKTGQYLSKKIDEGKLPESFRLIREAARAGGQGRGFSSAANQKRLLEEPKEIAEKIIRPKLTQNLNDIRELRDYIVESSTGVININTPIDDLTNKLKKVGFQDAETLLQGIKRNYKNLLSRTDSGNISMADANRFIKSIRSELKSKKELNSDIKQAAYKAVDDISALIANRIPDEEAIRIVVEDPNMLNRYRKYLADISNEDLAVIVRNKFKFQEGLKYDNAALKAAEKIKEKLKQIGTDTLLTPNQAKQLREIMRLTSPVKQLDSKMHKIMNASEILGDVIKGRSEAEVIDDVERIFKNLVSQPKDSAEAYLNRERYAAAMTNLRSALPDLVDEIESRVSPLIKDIEVSRYIRGEGFEKAGGEQGIIKKAVGDLGRIAAEGINVASQTKRAARLGESGPVVGLPTTAIYKPDVVVLTKLKDRVEKLSQASPDSKVYSMASGMIQNAINAQDEGRRAAILNTLMQYEFFRNMTKSENKE